MSEIAVIGAHGQLGSDLIRLWGERATALPHADIEITDPQSVDTALSAIHPRFVINTAAFNGVDRAVEVPSQAFAVNALGPLYLARWCADHDATFLHVSTDYVFGEDVRHSAPYAEADRPGPVSVYGASKLAGEHLVAQSCPKHFVVRTCGLYGIALDESKGNFVRTMLKLGAARDELRIVDDQHCTPTSTRDLADAINGLLATEDFGLYHATNAGQTTWYEFARTIFEMTKAKVRVTPISSSDYGAAARRPGYSVLDCRRIQSVAGLILRPWRDALAEYLAAD